MGLKPYPLFLIFAAITGCTPYSESFDCPPGRGVGCKSLNLINQMVEGGQLPLERENEFRENSLQGTSRKEDSLKNDPRGRRVPYDKGLYEARNIPRSLLPKNPLSSTTLSSAPLSSVAHMKLWVAAYEVEPGIIQGPSMVYIALNNPSENDEQNILDQSTTETP